MDRRVLLDTNLLILLIAGETDTRIIGRHKRLRTFRPVDYDLVCTFLKDHGRLVVLPNTATEASNLLAQIHDPFRGALRQTMRTKLAECLEDIVASQTAARRAEFLRLGLTDAAILCVLNDATTLLTADLDLFLAASAAGFAAQNFEHLRDRTF